MKNVSLLVLLFLVFACKEEPKSTLSAQEIVDKSIINSGGGLYKDHKVSFRFRDKMYKSFYKDGEKVLQRISEVDSITITDVKTNNDFKRFFNDSILNLPDSIANRYANSVNSVHYFSRLPLGLNDRAVSKKFLGKESIKDKDYYKVEVTFAKDGGGDDFDDVYIYWFDLESFKPSYLAYEFHVDGGGQRFREAFNERYVNGIRFVDYGNYKPKNKGTSIMQIAQLFERGELELLSKIELLDIQVD